MYKSIIVSRIIYDFLTSNYVNLLKFTTYLLEQY